MAIDAAQRTRTELGGEDAAVSLRIGWRNLVKRWGPRQLVPNWRSWSCLVLEPLGGNMTPALLTRTSSRLSLERNSSADFLMEGRSERSRWRKTSSPEAFGWALLILEMAFVALDSSRPAT